MNYQIIMDFNVVVIRKGGRCVRKTVDDGVVPIPGICVEDPVWGEPQKPIEITYNVAERYYHLQFPHCEFDTPEECELALEGYRLQGWEIL